MLVALIVREVLMKKKLFVFMLLLIISSVFSGCENAKLNSVISDTSSVPANEIDVKKFDGFTKDELESKRISKNQIFTNFSEVLKKKYDNFILPSNITIEQGELYSNIQFTQVSNFEKNAETIFQTFFGNLYTNELEITPVNTIYHTGKQINSENDKIFGAVLDNGLVSIIKPEGWDAGFGNDFEIVKIIHVDRGDDLSEIYNLADGKESIKDTVNYVNNWLDKNWTRWEPDFTFQVKTIEVKEIDDHYFYDIIVEKYYKGIPLDSVMNTSELSVDENGNMLLKYTLSFLGIRMCNMNSIDVFTNKVGIIGVKDTQTSEDGWLPLGECLDMLSKFFSEYEVYNVSDIELKYAMCPDYDSLGSTVKGFDFQYPGLNINAFPIWRLVIDIPRDQLVNENGTYIEGNQQYHIDINMRTGEVWFELEQK